MQLCWFCHDSFSSSSAAAAAAGYLWIINSNDNTKFKLFFAKIY